MMFRLPWLAFFCLSVLATLGCGRAPPVDANGKRLSHWPPNGTAITPKRDAKPWSNAQILAAGMLPRGPRSPDGQTLSRPGVKKSPSRVEVAKKRQASGLPAVPTGNIAVYTTEGAMQGLISSSLTEFDTFQIGTPAANFTLGGLTGYINIAVAGEDQPYIGGAVGGDGSTFSSNNDAYAFLSPVQITDGAASDTNNDIGSPSESNIWTINPSTLQLTARWINPDGSTFYPVSIFHDISYGDLDLAANLGQFVNTFSDYTEEVQFYFVPI